jgi:superfamily I DNA and/or RNA helicase
MIDTNENLVLINGQSQTNEIDSIQDKNGMGKYVVVFKNSPKPYSYKRENIVWMKKPSVLDPNKYRIIHHGIECQNIKTLLEFTSGLKRYYHIEYISGTMADFTEYDIEIEESCLCEDKSRKVFDYFKDVANANSLKTDEGTVILAYQYEKLKFVSNDTALAPYLYPQKYKVGQLHYQHLIFPFGCNNSQINAVKKAFKSQISVIQGPPGTGKTQTILNIIANILLQGKTVLVVSNNNSAIENVLEKLTYYGMGFMVAPLGCSDNKTAFVENQKEGRKYPEELGSWENESVRSSDYQKGIELHVDEIQVLFDRQEQLAQLRQELSDAEIEWEHFKKDFGEYTNYNTIIPSSKVLIHLNEQQDKLANRKSSVWQNIRHWIKKFIYLYYYKLDAELVENASDDSIHKLQSLFYQNKINELSEEISQLEAALESSDLKTLSETLRDDSMNFLKDYIFQKYGKRECPYQVKEESFSLDPELVLNEFPVVLSTTFSARNSLRNIVYDYLIMDEASQVSVETGVLVLSCARNAVIVGDTMQLPNVITPENEKTLAEIANHYEIDQGYDCASNSFLQSIIKILPAIPQTLLREHYRCAPDIINFCNQKFYGGKLVIMTKNDDESNTIFAVKTVKGNHSHNHINQREVEVITKEVLPKIKYKYDEIGIIAPYNMQVDTINTFVDPAINVATVHKFQGREKDAIIMSVVDDQISAFADDPNLLNVAVSRAKKQFCLVVTGNDQETKGNIVDLLGYIEYHNGSVTDSRIHSIYDMLYKQNEEARAEYLKEHKQISEYDSENLTHVLIKNILENNSNYSHLDVLCHYPLSLLINDYSPMTEEEKRYASNRSTHLDFLIYNRVSKKPLLAIEVDGWSFHQEGSDQSKRDKLKNHILPLYGIELVRLSTTGSNEKEIIDDKLKSMMLAS